MVLRAPYQPSQATANLYVLELVQCAKYSNKYDLSRRDDATAPVRLVWLRLQIHSTYHIYIYLNAHSRVFYYYFMHQRRWWCGVRTKIHFVFAACRELSTSILDKALPCFARKAIRHMKIHVYCCYIAFICIANEVRECNFAFGLLLTAHRPQPAIRHSNPLRNPRKCNTRF